MVNPVIIKGNNQGIRLIIAPEATINEIKTELRRKLQCTKNYYSNNKPIDIIFDGKQLTDDEIDEILCILNEKGVKTKHENNKNNINREDKKITDLQLDKDGLFYVGNLKNGQSINASTSIIIVGNIEQGASVISEGNIIVIGELSGYAKAGCRGNRSAFVYNAY